MARALDSLAPCPAPPGIAPQRVADAITAEARSSFGGAMRLLARPRREAMRAIYALARVLDDIADGDWPAAEKLRLLAEWRDEVDRVCDGAPVSAIGHALASPVERYRLPRGEFLMLIEAMETDALAPVFAPPLKVLRAYTRRAAGSVGLLSMRIFGAWRGAASERAALALGDAFQLTNILRDVAEDARRGRVYLPREALDAAGIASEPAAEIARHDALWRACAEVGRMARADFRRARLALSEHPRTQIAPALMMTGVYEGYLAALEARGFRPGHRIALSRAGKLWRGLAAIAAPVAPRGDG